MKKGHIEISLFDLFKTGPGPSSSHTIGPMKAALDFVHSLEKISAGIINKAESIDIHLFGSLSSTGKGHGTDRAIAGGLLGWIPETCDCDALSSLLQNPKDIYHISVNGATLSFSADNFHFEKKNLRSQCQNTMIFRLSDESKGTLFEKEYYSIGGGFIKTKGQKEGKKPSLPYEYGTMSELRNIVEKNKTTLSEVILANEKALTGKSEEEIFATLNSIVDVMCDAVSRGINREGVLPGPIKLQRKASEFYRKTGKMGNSPDKFLSFINSYALGAAEENAAGHRVVTAPTSGSSGVIPAIVYLLRHHFFILNRSLKEGLMAAAAMGFTAKHNASISGAEVGCQGEIGVASAMAAALIAHVNGFPVKQIENAAEIALEHHLGMTCDPVLGYVQIPCIERNAAGAVTAYNSYLLASIGNPHKQKVTFDEVVKAMLETGRDMKKKYRETAGGGLAKCAICC